MLSSLPINAIVQNTYRKIQEHFNDTPINDYSQKNKNIKQIAQPNVNIQASLKSLVSSSAHFISYAKIS